jgi:hypothetical protein
MPGELVLAVALDKRIFVCYTVIEIESAGFPLNHSWAQGVTLYPPEPTGGPVESPNCDSNQPPHDEAADFVFGIRGWPETQLPRETQHGLSKETQRVNRKATKRNSLLRLKIALL